MEWNMVWESFEDVFFIFFDSTIRLFFVIYFKIVPFSNVFIFILHSWFCLFFHNFSFSQTSPKNNKVVINSFKY